LFSDFNTDHGGNNERIGYVFDTRNVQFTGLGGNTTPLRKKADGEYVPLLSWWRQPYLASFRSGNFDFVMLSAHVRWGESELARRGELEGLADWVERRVGEKVVDDLDILVAGDFNIPDTKGALFKAITKHGLQLPRALAGLDHGSNLEKNKRYDQILHLPETKGFTGRGGVLDFYCGDHKPLFPGVNLTKEKFTYELSDHLPLWLEVDTDNDEERLDALLQKPKKG
jgi:endonuclease/exonuclease/phosphatase family metal-dependent hydrolase